MCTADWVGASSFSLQVGYIKREECDPLGPRRVGVAQAQCYRAVLPGTSVFLCLRWVGMRLISAECNRHQEQEDRRLDQLGLPF